MDMDLREARDVLANVDGVTVSERDGGAVIDLTTRSCHAAIALQGAQVLHWQPAGQSHDVLWLSPVARFGGGKAIRGGVPICWPWFGMHVEPGKPQHGYARNAVWSVVEAQRRGDDMHLVFALPADCAGREHLLGTAQVRFRITIGSALDMELSTTNTGTTPLTISHALHTYLRVGDVARIAIDGLDGATFRDNTDNGRAKEQHGLMTIPRETVALFDEAGPRHVLDDPALGRRIVVTRTSGRSSVVWNPGASAAGMGDIPPPCQTEFVCIESGSVGHAATLVAPGATAVIGQRLDIETG
jgi:glucose-6-phosphate 1-epimerase